MSTSSRNLFRRDPPEILTYTDWVISAPVPRLPRDMSGEVAKDQYPRTRLKRLIRVVEARLGRNRCFFSECRPRDKKKDSQFEITKLYSLHEVEHWPGAFAQYEWTQFVIANMERDANIEQLGSSARLALPTLPASALHIFQAMMRQERLDSGRAAMQSGQIRGVAAGTGHHDYTLADPRRNELYDRPNLRHLQTHLPSASQVAASQKLQGGWLNPTSAEIQAAAQSDHKFEKLKQFHSDYINKLFRSLYRCYMRYFGRRPNMHLRSWEELTQAARQAIKHNFATQMQRYHEQNPDVPHDPIASEGALDAQVRFFQSYYRLKYPTPVGSSAQVQEESLRIWDILASCKQRKILLSWVDEMVQRVSRPDGERYRKEGDRILDLWTGNCEEFATFDERNRREATGLNADMLPTAVEARIHQPQVQQQNKAQVQGQTPGLAFKNPAHSQSQDRHQQPLMNSTQLSARMQERAPSPTQTQDAEQMPVDGKVQLQVTSLEQNEGRDANQVQNLGHEGIRGQEDGFDQAQVPDHELLDAGMNASAQRPEPLQLPDSMHIDAPQPAAVEPPVPQQVQAQVQQHLRSPSLGVDQARTLEQFQAQVHAAAQEHATHVTQAQPETSMWIFDPELVKEAIHEDVEEQEKLEAQEPAIPRTEYSQAMAAQEQVELQAPEIMQSEAHAPEPILIDEHAGSLLQEAVEAGLNNSLDVRLQNPSQLPGPETTAAVAHNHVDDNVPGKVAQTAALQEDIHSQTQEASCTETQEVDEPDGPDRTKVEPPMQEDPLANTQELSQTKLEAPTAQSPTPVTLSPPQDPVVPAADPAETDVDSGMPSETHKPVASDIDEDTSHDDLQSPGESSMPQREEESNHEPTQSKQSTRSTSTATTTRPKQPKPFSKAPPKKQAPMQTTRKRKISNVTTRAAEQKAADGARRSLRPRKG